MENDTCYWIFRPGRFARTECNNFVYLDKSLSSPEDKALDIYRGSPCPMCGKFIVTDSDSYALIRRTNE